MFSRHGAFQPVARSSNGFYPMKRDIFTIYEKPYVHLALLIKGMMHINVAAYAYSRDLTVIGIKNRLSETTVALFVQQLSLALGMKVFVENNTYLHSRIYIAAPINEILKGLDTLSQQNRTAYFYPVLREISLKEQRSKQDLTPFENEIEVLNYTQSKY